MFKTQSRQRCEMETFVCRLLIWSPRFENFTCTGIIISNIKLLLSNYIWLDSESQSAVNKNKYGVCLLQYLF